MSLKLNSSGGGSVTLNEPVTANNRNVNLPDANTTLVGTDVAQTLTNKTLTSPTIDSAPFPTVSGSAPLYAARAWVNFNGTGTVAIRASGNVSSITDNGTGDYTVNFANPMVDANYEFSLSCQGAGAGNTLVGVEQHQATTPTSSAIRVLLKQTLTALDRDYVCVAIFR